MPTIYVGGNRVYLSDRYAEQRLGELRSRSGSGASLSERDQEMLDGLEDYIERDRMIRSRVAHPGSTEGVGQIGFHDDVPASRAWTPTETHSRTAGNPDQSLYRARRTVDSLHSRSLIPDRAAVRISKLLDVDAPDERWRNSEMVNLLGSDDYAKAFVEGIRSRMHGLPMTEKNHDLVSRAMALSPDASGGFAVPFQLDPTVILTSAGAIDPIRNLARTETGTAKELDLVTSAGVTASYAAEATEAGDNSPTLAQPNIRANRLQAFVPYSMELEASWANITQELTGLLTDASGLADAQAHISGNGTAPNPQGIVTGLSGTANEITTTSTASVQLADLLRLQATVPPRFRRNSQFAANLALIQAALQMQVVTGQSAVQGSFGSGGQLTLLGDPLNEASYISGQITTGGGTQVVAVAGDFQSGYCIYDVLPSVVEPIPHLFGTARGYPTGQRGLYLMRFSGAKVINPAALAQLKVR